MITLDQLWIAGQHLLKLHLSHIQISGTAVCETLVIFLDAGIDGVQPVGIALQLVDVI